MTRLELFEERENQLSKNNKKKKTKNKRRKTEEKTSIASWPIRPFPVVTLKKDLHNNNCPNCRYKFSVKTSPPLHTHTAPPVQYKSAIIYIPKPIYFSFFRFSRSVQHYEFLIHQGINKTTNNKKTHTHTKQVTNLEMTIEQQ